MSNLITLTCPSSGGRLEVTDGQQLITSDRQLTTGNQPA